MTVTPKSVYVKTYGCQMNVYDSERMRDTLKGMGYAETPVPDLADLVIFNTCHIREHAAEKVYSELGRMKRLKTAKAESGGEMLVAVAGCVAQAEGAEIIRRAKTVDLVFGPQTYHRLPDLIARRLKTGDAIVETDFPAEDKFVALEQQNANRVLNRNVSAFLTVQEGCDKFCSFCVVPYTRGAEFSRPPSQIEREARRLADAGVREITLLGQNVNAYHGEGLSLAGLIAMLSHISGIKRLRYTTKPSEGYGRSVDRGPCQQPEAHALPASAGSKRQRPHPESDEPGPRYGRLHGHCRKGSGGTARHGTVG